MADSDLFQHLLSVESLHDISPSHNPSLSSFNFLSNYNLNTTPTPTPSTTASCTSISSLSAISDDTFDDIAVSEIVDGGLQRALVIMFRERNNIKPKHSPIHSKGIKNIDEIQHDMNRNIDININRNRNDDNRSNTFSFESWMASYKNQPQQLINRNRKRIKNKKLAAYRRKLARSKSNKSKPIIPDNMNNINNNDDNKQNINNNNNNQQILLYLSKLRKGLPFNPDKLRQIIKHREILQNDRNNIDQYSSDLHEIDLIQRKILILQNRLNELRNTEKMKLKLKYWKNFKLNWMDWRLIDFYEYLIRINNRKYCKYIFNFDLFYLKWMEIYQNDQDGNNSSSRFLSYIFNGRMLIYLDHNDLILFGIHLKEDRREILMRIQRLNGFRN